MPHLEGRRKVHRRHLAPDGFHDLRPAVTGVHAPQTCTAVEDLAAFGGPVIHALGTGKQARRLLELPVGGIRHPEGRLLQPCHDFGALIHGLKLSRGNLPWHITPDAMLYYTYSQGYRPGAFNRVTGGRTQIWVGPNGQPLANGVAANPAPSGCALPTCNPALF